MFRQGKPLLFSVLAALIGGGAGTSVPVARLLEVKGAVTITSSQGKDRPAAIFATVYETNGSRWQPMRSSLWGFVAMVTSNDEAAGMATAGHDGLSRNLWWKDWLYRRRNKQWWPRRYAVHR